MNWRLVGCLASLGVAMGVLSLFGLTRHGVEPILWLAIAVGCAFWIARRAPSRPFLHGLLVGLFAGIANGLVQAAFFDAYLAHNPEAAEAMSRAPAGFDARLFVLLGAPLIGSVYGLVLGGLTWLGARAIPSRKLPAA